MFDDDFKFDFEDMEGLSLNGDVTPFTFLKAMTITLSFLMTYLMMMMTMVRLYLSSMK